MLNQQPNTDLSSVSVQFHSPSVGYKHELVNVVSIDMGIKNVSVCKFLWTRPVPAPQPKQCDNTFSYASNIVIPDSPIVSKLENNATVKVGESPQHDATFQKKYLETLESLLQFGNPWIKSNEIDAIPPCEPNSSKGSDTSSNSLFSKKSCNAKSGPFPFIELPIIYSWERLDLEQIFQPGASDTSKWQPFGLEHLNFLATNLVQAITQSPPDLPFCDTNLAKPQDASENLQPITKISTRPKNDNVGNKQELNPKTVVLIERQRFRSSSSSNILEWTLRINRLEMAVYSILKSLRQNVIVHSISPKAVLNYWKMVYPDLVNNQQTDDSSDYTETSALEPKTLKKGKRQSTKDVYKLGKQTKLDIAARIIQDSTMFGNPGLEKKTDSVDPVLGIGLYSGIKDQHNDPVGTPANAVLSSSSWFKQSPMHVRLQKNGIEATGSHHDNGTMAGPCQAIADSYNYKLSLLEKPKKTKVGGKLKADDLADSMLQGLAWCNWQRNIDKVCDLLMSNSRNGSQM